MAKFFIDRPVFSTVISVIIVLCGLLAMLKLPIAQFPQIVPPTVEIAATYPGANAETVASSVAAPIEQQLSGAKNMIYFQSQCSNDGKLKTIVTFEIGSDLDLAAVEVQQRLAKAEPTLPEEVKRQGITITKKSTDILMMVTLNSDDPQYNDLYLSNYAVINIIDPIKRVPGVGDATIFGAGDYAMRIWLNPDRMAQKKITVSDISAAVKEQNGLFAAGRIGQRPNPTATDLTMTVTAPGRLSEPGQFDDIILRANPDGSMIRVKDIGRAELGALSYDLFARQNGKPTTAVLLYLQPGANALATAEAVREKMKELSAAFPKGVTHEVPLDTTEFVSVSIEAVVHTFFEAVVLVLVVVFIFLQSARATLIPLLAVPVSIVGTFIGMQALGFSINSLTLFGMVLAIGIVVDDAIVVVENVERIMHEEHLPVREATIKAMEEVTGPVIAIVLVLAAVFLPVAFLGGLTGVMYQQFAVTIAISVAISGLVALTFSPALCRLMLKPGHGAKTTGPFGWFNRAFDKLTAGYVAGVKGTIRAAVLSLAAFGVVIFGIWALFARVPGGFIPDEDQGYFFGAVQMPSGSSLDRTDELVRQVEAYFLKQPEVQFAVVLGGNNIFANAASTDATQLFITLKHWKDRKKPEEHAFAVIQRANEHFARQKEGVVIIFNPPAVTGLGTRAGFEFQLQNRATGDVRQLADVTDKFLSKLRQRKEVTGVATPLSVTLPQLSVDVNREKTRAMGVPISDVFATLQAFWGSYYINDFDKFGRVWKVYLQAEPQYRTEPQDVSNIFVRNSTGAMSPMSQLVTMKFQAGPNFVSRFNSYTSVAVTGAPAAGFSTGQAMQALRDVAAEVLPQGFGYEWSGASYQEIKAGNQAPMVMGFGLIVVFLVLAAQYEKWSLPVAVLLAVPLGILGALVAVWLRGLTNDIYFQIGLLTLVGLAAKNAILIVEFCIVLRKQGKSVREAAIEAARLRFRPILMTSLAFILGVVPLAISTGAGAAGRHSIGTGVLGGMIAATVLAVFFVPLFYFLIQGTAEKLTRKSDAPDIPPAAAPVAK